MAANQPLKQNEKVKPDISAKRLRELIKKYRPDLHEHLENREIEYLKRLLTPSEDEDLYIDYGFEQEVAKGGKVYGNSTRKSQYKAG